MTEEEDPLGYALTRDELELVKCITCGWVHFLIDDSLREQDSGYDNCFRCGAVCKDNIVPAKEIDDCPLGCTLCGIYKDNINITK